MDMDTISLAWSGPVLDPSGYGEASRGYLSGLSRIPKTKIKVMPKYFWHGDMPDIGEHMDMIKRLQAEPLDLDKPYIFIQHLTPDQYRLGAGKCKYHIGITTFETDTIPATWQVNMRSMDELWTFTAWGQQVFEEAGIRRPITVVPHGVDVIRFRPGLQKIDLGDRFKDRFVIGSVFEWTERKNPRGLLLSYWGAFKPTDPVVLVLKVFYQYPFEKTRAYVESYIANLKREMGLSQTPPVVLINGIVSAEEMPRFYNTCDCYFLPSRGEGWGLTYSESMACGVPCIAVNWSGHTEFMNADNSLLCDDYKLREITKEECKHQPHYLGMRWADPNPAAMAHQLRYAFEHRDQLKLLGKQARADMMKLQWKSVSYLGLGRIKEIWNSFL